MWCWTALRADTRCVYQDGHPRRSLSWIIYWGVQCIIWAINVWLLLKILFILSGSQNAICFPSSGFVLISFFFFSLIVRHQSILVWLLGWIIDISLCLSSFNFVTKPHSRFHSFQICLLLHFPDFACIVQNSIKHFIDFKIPMLAFKSLCALACWDSTEL